MENWKSASKKTSAFTIVELLTVMAVIAILIGLLVPALALVKDFAREIQQRAQFHSIEVGIDMFVADSEYGTYPPSYDVDPSPPGAPLGLDPRTYCGALKLAEAVVGLDLFGYHPKSAFRSDGLNDVNGNDTVERVYDASNGISDGNAGAIILETALQNRQMRKGPSIDLENANAFMMGEIYQAASLDNGDFDAVNYVLCDVFTKNRHSGKKTGMPILYYRARTEYFEQNSTDQGRIADDIYYYPDNQELLLLGTPEVTPVAHPLADGVTDHEDFENMIRNDQITTLSRPYRTNSYILISAGKDGLYGSGDDLTNFAKE